METNDRTTRDRFRSFIRTKKRTAGFGQSEFRIESIFGTSESRDVPLRTSRDFIRYKQLGIDFGTF